MNTVPILYDQDFYLWLKETAASLRARQFDDLDSENLAEEIESMFRSEKRAVKSNLKIVLLNLLKYRYQPQKRTKSWKSTIREHRQRLRDSFVDSPSLKPYFEEVFEECYVDALALAADETRLARDAFPPGCPFSQMQVLDMDFLPG